MGVIQLSDVSGGPLMLGSVLNGVPLAGPLHYHLFKNNFTVTPASILADFTEATEAGYAPQDVPLSGWIITVTPSGTTLAENADIAFGITAAGTWYGYFVTSDDGDLLYAQQFNTAITFGGLGGTITVTPKFQLKTPIP